METTRFHPQRPEQRPQPAGYDVVCRPSDDVLTEDDPNYGVRSISDVFIENQGTHIVKVKNNILMPGDVLRILCPPGWVLEDTINVRFLSAMPLNNPLAMYPNLYNSPRLLVSYIPYPRN